MKKKILIVDDVPGWVRFHELNLLNLGIDMEIDRAYSAKEALSKVECAIDFPYDTIFTDLQMESDFLPKTAGQWLIEQIKMFKEYDNTKITIISASPSIGHIAQKFEVDYFSKTNARNAQSEDYKNFI